MMSFWFGVMAAYAASGIVLGLLLLFLRRSHIRPSDSPRNKSKCLTQAIVTLIATVTTVQTMSFSPSPF